LPTGSAFVVKVTSAPVKTFLSILATTRAWYTVAGCRPATGCVTRTGTLPFAMLVGDVVVR
jgi:hypothetical protein